MVKKKRDPTSNVSDKAYRCRVEDKELYDQLKLIVDLFTSEEMLFEAWHIFCTQKNESLNNTFSYLAPKNRTFSGSMSLTHRIMLAIGINVLGYNKFLSIIMQRLHIDKTSTVDNFLIKKDIARTKHADLHASSEHKTKRAQKHVAKMKTLLLEKLSKNKKQEEDYAVGIGLNNENIVQSTIEKKTKKGNTCSRCQKSGHTTTRSKNCLFHNEWLIRPTKKTENQK